MREGYSVKIRRFDGTWFLCASAQGILPPVWTLSQRRLAAAHRDDLIKHGLVARITRVRFDDVHAIANPPRARRRPAQR